MRKWILRLLNGVPKENITLVGLIQASTMEELNRAIAEVYHSHVYRHRPRKGTTSMENC